MNTLFADGKEIRDRSAWYNWLMENMEFPEYFGRNLDAFEECLLDYLDNRLPLVITIKSPTDFLAHEDDVFRGSVLSIMRDASSDISENSESISFQLASEGGSKEMRRS